MLPLYKTYFSISEVCQETGLEQHVLRYWETEFSQLKPKKNRAGKRAYKLKEINLIKFIKTLLYDELYTIQGAKKRLNELPESTINELEEAKGENSKGIWIKINPGDLENLKSSISEIISKLKQKV